MRTIFYCLIVVLLFTGVESAFGKGFREPSPGKAVVYFARVMKWGGIASFEFFHQDKYIGAFTGKDYLRYECDPGQQLLWASSENKEFLKADLKEGDTYIVIVDVHMGATRGRVGLHPITTTDIDFEKVKKLIMSFDEIIPSQKEINKMNVKLADFMKEKLAMYETEWKHTKNFKSLTPDMAIPAEAMK